MHKNHIYTFFIVIYPAADPVIFAKGHAEPIRYVVVRDPPRAADGPPGQRSPFLRIVPQGAYCFMQKNRPRIDTEFPFYILDALFKNKKKNPVLMRRMPFISLVSQVVFAERS